MQIRSVSSEGLWVVGNGICLTQFPWSDWPSRFRRTYQPTWVSGFKPVENIMSSFFFPGARPSSLCFVLPVVGETLLYYGFCTSRLCAPHVCVCVFVRWHNKQQALPSQSFHSVSPVAWARFDILGRSKSRVSDVTTFPKPAHKPQTLYSSLSRCQPILTALCHRTQLTQLFFSPLHLSDTCSALLTEHGMSLDVYFDRSL